MELPEGGSWAGAGDGTSEMGVTWDAATFLPPLYPTGAVSEPWADLGWCPRDGCCFADPQGLGLTCN